MQQQRRNFTKELILLILEAYGAKDICERCGKPNVSVHHVIPIYKGGKNTIMNVEFLCRDCMKDSRRLNFKHGDKEDYQRKYMNWYWHNRPEKYERQKERMRQYLKERRKT